MRLGSRPVSGPVRLARVARGTRVAVLVGSWSLLSGCQSPGVDPAAPDADDAALDAADGGSNADGESAGDALDEASADAGPAGPCTPRTCAQLGYDCGAASDGCGGTLHCGACTAPDTCSGGGAYNQCGTFPFQGRSCLMVCSQLPDSANCNQLSDGCGHLMDLCGSEIACSLPSQGTCGGGGVPFRCGSGAKCTPLTCAQLNYNCGRYGDGCSGSIDCGVCAGSQICGGGGFNRCGPKLAASP
jgi:hypothetical protein